MSPSDTRAASGERRSGLQVVSRAADVLRALGDHPQGLSLAALSAAVDLPKSSVHRLVGALGEEGLVSVAEGGSVRIGPLVGRLARVSEPVLGDELHQAMRQLSSELEETVDLAVLEGDSLRFVAQQPGPKRLRAISAVGARFPLHCTSNGKALLASMPRDEAAAVLPRRLPALTENTITSKRELWLELDAIAEAGVAFDREEHNLGIAAVGAVVRDHRGTKAAISVPVPAQRFYGHEDALAGRLRTVCQPLLDGE